MLVLQGGLLRSRILGISPSRTATACCALPLKEFLEQVTADLALKSLASCIDAQTGWGPVQVGHVFPLAVAPASSVVP